MSSNYIFTKRLMGIDGKVLITMLITLLLLTGLLSYTIIKTNKEVPCKPFDIRVFGERNIENKTYAAGDQIIFRVAAGVNDKVTWDFGDNSPKTEGAGTRHTFAEEKIFPVTATLNGRCRSSIKIHIKKEEKKHRDDSGNIVTPIIGPLEAFEDDLVTFTTPIEASSYRWSIDRSGYPVKNSKDAIFTFKKSGTYSVRLVVDDDRKKEYEFTIHINEIKKLIDDDEPIVIPPIERDEKAPPIEAPPQSNTNESVAPTRQDVNTSPFADKVSTSDDNLKDHLQSFLCGKTSLPKLEQYFCDLSNTRVTISEEKKVTSTTLAGLCNSIKCKKDIEILSISEVYRSPDKKCVTSFLIHIRKTKQKRACPDN